MGEYAKLVGTGEEVKIGTCEDMLYLRADQRHLVWPQYGNVNPQSAEDQKSIRFRFPWPDEDGIAPGGFDNPFRKLAVHQPPPEHVTHNLIQFRAAQGYNISLPCPEGNPGAVRYDWGDEPIVAAVHRNGFAGATFLTQQAFRGGNLVPVFECVCGARWAAWDLADIAEAIEDLAKRAREADRLRRLDPEYKRIGEDPRATWLRQIAMRIGAGYKDGPLAKLAAEASELEAATI